jgi:acyl-CoA reductase-like NAD-dependent aldehyde dehydrogenase
MGPLTASLSAGNTAILKPSELCPNVSSVVADIITEYFDEEYVTVFQGGKDIATKLLELPFDHIMYTGGTAVGKIVMEAAAKNLTPVTLELGGKSPAIIDQQLHLAKSAKRIVMSKFINCGQTCMAPDHLFVHEKIADQFIDEMKRFINQFFGDNPLVSQDYGKIISKKHFDRVKSYLNDGKIVVGGEVNEEELYIAPTLMVNVDYDSSIMTEEVFGPVLPIITYSNLDEVINRIISQPKPLSLYIYSNNRAVHEKVLSETSSGGVAINDSITQFISMNLPFGGVGNSGMGRYHGHYGFETFSHHKAVMKQSNLIDLSMRYPPVTEKTVNMLKKVLK